MKRPCPLSLSMAKVPAKRWATREDLLRQVELARAWMEASPGRYSLEQIAGLAAISPYHFHRLFRATYGHTPLQHLTECRLQLARTLLLEGRPVGEVCAEVGYESRATFSRLFRRRFGHPPSRVGPAVDLVG